MFRKLHALLGNHKNFVAVKATAEDTSLPPASVDFITAAQAFHWFEGPAALAEFHRVLRPEGRFALIRCARVLPSINFETTKHGQSSVLPTS